jgi:tetratricopeptide (TPR) repeat protein
MGAKGATPAPLRQSDAIMSPCNEQPPPTKPNKRKVPKPTQGEIVALIKSGQLELALRRLADWDQALGGRPANVATKLFCLNNLGRFSEAYLLGFDSFAELSENENFLVNFGISAERSGHFSAGYLAGLRLLDIRPQDNRLRLSVASLAGKAGRHDDLQSICGALISSSDIFIKYSALKLLVESRSRAGDLSGALNILKMNSVSGAPTWVKFREAALEYEMSRSPEKLDELIKILAATELDFDDFEYGVFRLLGAGLHENALTLLNSKEVFYSCSPYLHNLKAAAYENARNYRLAIRNFLKAIRAPECPPEAKYNLAGLLHKIGLLQKATAYYEQVLREFPDWTECAVNLALLYMKLGRWREGYKLYAHRGAAVLYRSALPGSAEGLPSFEDVILDGGEKILVYWEQGFGDTIHYSRYIKILARRVKRVDFLIQPELRNILIYEEENVRVVLEGESILESPYDHRVPLMSLPSFLNLDGALPPPPSTIRAQRVQVSNNIQSDEKLRVGVCWSGSRSHVNDDFRSVPIKEFEQLFRWCPEVGFVGLGRDTPQHEIEALGKNFRNFQMSTELDSFSGLISALELVDLVVTVDTAVAHIASSMSKPTFILLSKFCDFRWGDSGDASLLYPTCTLIRQSVLCQWDSVIQIAAGLINKNLSRV